MTEFVLNTAVCNVLSETVKSLSRVDSACVYHGRDAPFLADG